MAVGEDAVITALTREARPMRGDARELEPILETIGDARYVLIGEATHGTSDFYRVRAELTKRLVLEKGFSAVAAEADWPDAYRVNRYVRGGGDDHDAGDALSSFKRFPTWMWRNLDMLELVSWLRGHNDGRLERTKVGFYGLDIYSLHASIDAVLGYLDTHDPEAAKRARFRYGCFEEFREDVHAYGYAASFGLSESCEQQVVDQLLEMQQRSADELRRGGLSPEDERFQAEQNARVVKNAEEYYRESFRGRVSSWNLRDTHMADTLDALVNHLGSRGSTPKVVVWAHNSHVGDARATEVGGEGELNIGQLVRERHGDATCLIGLTTYTGTVTAASEWGGDAERKEVRPALDGSYEDLFHRYGAPRFLLPLRDMANPEPFMERRLHRAIGVIYRPQSERTSHYYHARLAEQFDAVVHLDTTHALQPLQRTVKPASESAATGSRHP